MSHTDQMMDACKVYIKTEFHPQRFQGMVEDDAPRAFVTLSRQTGAGGITVGRLLVDALEDLFQDPSRAHLGSPSWTIFDKNLVSKVLEDHKLSERMADYMPESKHSEIRDMIEELFGLHPAEWSLVKKTSETLFRLATVGHVILVGRGAHIVARRLPGGIHVRLIGSYRKRVQHVMSYYELSHLQAEQKVKEEDEGRRHYLKKYFGKDIDDALLYDLVINTDAVSYEEAARIIAQSVVRLETSMNTAFSRVL